MSDTCKRLNGIGLLASVYRPICIDLYCIAMKCAETKVTTGNSVFVVFCGHE